MSKKQHLYASSVGCPVQFTSVVTLTDPPPFQVLRECPACHLAHSFLYRRTYQVDTPHQQKWFVSYCEQMGIEMNTQIEGVQPIGGQTS